jgi:predicted esterase
MGRGGPLITVVAAWAVGLGTAAPARGQDAGPEPARLEPGSPGATPGVVYQWTSGVKGLRHDEEGRVVPSDQALRYTWVLPAGHEPGRSYDLVVICHGTGLDYRWGYWNFPPGPGPTGFRPRDIVISVDGTTEVRDARPTSPRSSTTGPAAPARLFLGMRADALAFRSFLLEVSRAFRAGRIYLYGHSQGGFFVAYFAGEFPALVDGVVAQSSGAWNWSKDRGGVRQVPLVFLHGTRDPVVPYDQSPAARNAYRAAGHPMVHLRRMPRFNHWPNPVRASECIDWCIGMRTADAAEALAMAESLLAPKAPDQYEYTGPVDYAGARAILRRIESAEPGVDAGEEGAGKGGGAVPPALKGMDAAIRARARDLAARIEAEGARHVAVLRERVRTSADLSIDAALAPRPGSGSGGREGGGGGEWGWIGHLVSVREDFRGVDAVEAYVKELDLDAVLAAHAKAAAPIEEAWFAGAGEDGPDPGATFSACAENLPRCFLHEGMPPALAARLAQWKAQADSAAIPAAALERWAVIEAWRSGWEEGDRQYAAIWRQWR